MYELSNVARVGKQQACTTWSKLKLAGYLTGRDLRSGNFRFLLKGLENGFVLLPTISIPCFRSLSSRQCLTLNVFAWPSHTPLAYRVKEVSIAQITKVRAGRLVEQKAGGNNDRVALLHRRKDRCQAFLTRNSKLWKGEKCTRLQLLCLAFMRLFANSETCPSNLANGKQSSSKQN